MALQSLGYYASGSRKLDDWAQFGGELLGMQVTERTGSSLALRMDDHRQRVFLDADAPEGSHCFGWEVADAAALDHVAAQVEAAGVPVARGSADFAARRRVAGLVSFADPGGNRVELFHGAEIAAEPFRPGRSISGFRTGPLGLGHAVLTVTEAAPLVRFYQDVLGFRLSDYMYSPFEAYFFHINPRHHSLAIIQSGQAGLHHLMVELFQLDDVGQGYDLAQKEGRIGVSLGRHTNDYMTSFYARTPSDFMVEYGWGGRSLDLDAWQARELTEGPSLWGHERGWLPPEQRQAALEARLRAGAAGLRAPVQVLPGNYNVMAGTCAVWDRLAQAAD